MNLRVTVSFRNGRHTGSIIRREHNAIKAFGLRCYSSPAVSYLDALRKEMRTDAETSARHAMTINRFQEFVQQYYDDKYTVQACGSTLYGAGLPRDDLDLVILDPDRPQGFMQSLNPNVKGWQGPKVYHLENMKDLMRKKGKKKFTRITQITGNGSIPIIKFQDSMTDISCYVNVNDRLSMMTSELLQDYCNHSEYLAPMIYYLKSWTKSRNLDSPSYEFVAKRGKPSKPECKVASFSSNALAMMTVTLLQARGFLPNLQAGLPPLEKDAKHGWFWPRVPLHTPCDVRWNKEVEFKSQPVTDETFRALMQDWFEVWGYKFAYEKWIISPRHGSILCKDETHPEAPDSPTSQTSPTAVNAVISDNPVQNVFFDLPLKQHEDVQKLRRAWKWPSMYMLDPFIRSKNVMQNVMSFGLDQFVRSCRSTYEDMQRGNPLHYITPDAAPGFSSPFMGVDRILKPKQSIASRYGPQDSSTKKRRSPRPDGKYEEVGKPVLPPSGLLRLRNDIGETAKDKTYLSRRKVVPAVGYAKNRRTTGQGAQWASFWRNVSDDGRTPNNDSGNSPPSTDHSDKNIQRQFFVGTPRRELNKFLDLEKYEASRHTPVSSQSYWGPSGEDSKKNGHDKMPRNRSAERYRER